MTTIARSALELRKSLGDSDGIVRARERLATILDALGRPDDAAAQRPRVDEIEAGRRRQAAVPLDERTVVGLTLMGPLKPQGKR